MPHAVPPPVRSAHPAPPGSAAGAARTARAARPTGRLVAAVAVALGLAAAAVGSVATPAHAAPVLPTAPMLVAAPATVDPGDVVDVTVTLPAVADVYAAELTLDVDPALLALVDDSVTGPEGGFDDALVEGRTVTLVHARLGTSPGLAGDVVTSVSFTALAPGAATVALTGITLVGADGVVAAAGPAGLPAAPVTVLAPPVAPGPSPDPGAGAPPEPAPQPTQVAPAPGAAPTPSATTVAVADRDALAWTGPDLGPLLGITAAAALLGAGALALAALRHRRLAREDGADR